MMDTAKDIQYQTMTLGNLRQSLLTPIKNAGLQLRSFVIENLSIDPGSNMNAWKNGTRWLSVTDKDKNKAKVCISKHVWKRAVDNGYEISTDVSIDVAINGLSLDKWYQVQIDAMAIRVSGQSQLEALRDSIIKYCESKGYFDRTKRPLPVIVRNIAIVTTKNSTIESDITKQIGIKPSFIEAYRFNGKADDLCLLLKSIVSKNRYDIICLYRGGREDEYMFVFSDPSVVDQVVKSPIAVVSALGHERDIPPIQLVVDAGFASPSKFATSIRHRNDAALEQAQKYTKDIIVHYKNYLAAIDNDLLLTIGPINSIVSDIEQKQSASRHKRTIAVIVFFFILILGFVIFYFIATKG